MSMFSTLMILILTGSIAICLLIIGRIFAYNRKYRLPESQYTKLFHIASKEHILIIYIFFVLMNLGVGIWYIFKI